MCRPSPHNKIRRIKIRNDNNKRNNRRKQRVVTAMSPIALPHEPSAYPQSHCHIKNKQPSTTSPRFISASLADTRPSPPEHKMQQWPMMQCNAPTVCLDAQMQPLHNNLRPMGDVGNPETVCRTR
ncbi:hypothetical protein B0T14DRAFT_200015 [Immersiella caudata]|uniref:Uncharacterized protein n=1 Tax=Immersiella caudata TaxID=314043 RepID=A0AA39WP96_9PEZI|nr:hypothetical protein B0T14DRAFT_200015 [Immersiella caudata]